MAILKLYAGSTVASMSELPSPIDLKCTHEQIWSENTGRAQSGTNKAKMIGDVVAQKTTYQIKWGIINGTQLQQIKDGLTKGFFYFAVGTSQPSSASKYYRGEISFDWVQAGNQVMYKDVSVSVIEQ